MKPTADIAVQRKKDYTSIKDQTAFNPALQDILIPVPKAVGDSQKNIQTFTKTTAIDRHKDFTIKEIDDSLIAGFDLETFNHIRFTVWKRIKLFFEHTFPFFTQSFFQPIFKLVFSIIFKVEISGKSNLKGLKGPTLFIANHIGFYDSFMFDLFVKPFSHFLPFRFMGTRKFIVPALTLLKMIGIVDLVYFFFGVFRITPGEGAEKSLKKAYEIIRSKGTVVMYPEGRIWKPTHVHPEPIGPFKWGAAILAKNTGVQVVPVLFRKVKVEGKKTRMIIKIGKLYIVDSDKKAEDIALGMKESVTTLYLS